MAAVGLEPTQPGILRTGGLPVSVMPPTESLCKGWDSNPHGTLPPVLQTGEPANCSTLTWSPVPVVTRVLRITKPAHHLLCLRGGDRIYLGESPDDVKEFPTCKVGIGSDQEPFAAGPIAPSPGELRGFVWPCDARRKASATIHDRHEGRYYSRSRRLLAKASGWPREDFSSQKFHSLRELHRPDRYSARRKRLLGDPFPFETTMHPGRRAVRPFDQERHTDRVLGIHINPHMLQKPTVMPAMTSSHRTMPIIALPKPVERPRLPWRSWPRPRATASLGS